MDSPESAMLTAFLLPYSLRLLLRQTMALEVHCGPLDVPGNGLGYLTYENRQGIFRNTGVSVAIRQRKKWKKEDWLQLAHKRD